MLVENYLAITKSITVLITNHQADLTGTNLSRFSIFSTNIDQLPSTHNLLSLKYNLFSLIIQPRIQSWSPLDNPSYFFPILSLAFLAQKNDNSANLQGNLFL
jgi:hypothetical protein